MWQLLKLSWRSLFRNKRRTLIAGSAIGIGLASLVFSDGLILGTKEVMIRNMTGSFLGEGQIHGPGFRETGETDRTIQDLGETIAALEHDPRVAHFTVRTLAIGMISSAANHRSVLLAGVNPDLERHVSQVAEAVTQGRFLEQESPQSIVIGAKLAQDLEVSLGDRVVTTMAQAGSGDLVQELFRVSGIFEFRSRELDGGLACVNLEKARGMLAIGEAAHEIALKFADPKIPGDAGHAFWKAYSRRGNEALGWPRLMPQVEASLELMEISLYVIAAILFAIVAFGIINTLFMSIHERTFEFGVLRAIGTRPFRVGLQIVCEAGALGVFSVVMGLVLGAGLNWAFSMIGFDYRGIEFEGVTIRNLIYPVISARQFWIYPLSVLAFTVLAGIYPAVHAARIAPAEAMRRSL